MMAGPKFTDEQLDALRAVGVAQAQIAQAEALLPPLEVRDPENLYPLIGLQTEVDRTATSVVAAKEVLAMAAEHLERGEELPAPLASFLASAFRQVAAVKPHEEDRLAAVLAQALNLTAPNRRPAAVQAEVGAWVFREMTEHPDESATHVCTRAARHFEVSVTTANKLWRDWRGANASLAAKLEPIRAQRRRMDAQSAG